MKQYRIIEDARGAFLIQKRRWWGWWACDRYYFAGGSFALRRSLPNAKERLAEIIADDAFRRRVVHEEVSA